MSRKITLNKHLVFEPDKKTISHKGHKTVISASASMFMELLIENVGVLVTHQQFYNLVWRRFGTEPASTSIYQNISILRRALIKVGYDQETIRTMPRKGFLLSSKTNIVKEEFIQPICVAARSESVEKATDIKNDATIAQRTSDEEPITSDEEPITLEEDLDKGKKYKFSFQDFSLKISTKIKKPPYGFISTLVFVIFFLLIPLFYHLTYQHGSPEEYDETFNYNTEYKDCIFYTNIDTNITSTEVIKVAQKINMDCKGSHYVYLTNFKGTDGLSYFKCQYPLNFDGRVNCHSHYSVKNFYNE